MASTSWLVRYHARLTIIRCEGKAVVVGVCLDISRVSLYLSFHQMLGLGFYVSFQLRQARNFRFPFLVHSSSRISYEPPFYSCLLGADADQSCVTGLKAQHAACIRCLAEATAAETTGCVVGSKTVSFRPRLSPIDLVNRNIKVKAESVGSILLVFQCLLPFLIFAGDEEGSPITLVIQGGTNVSFSLSFEYLDQVLLPSLKRFGVKVERKLGSRGWSNGTIQIGSADFKITPLPLGQPLAAPKWPSERGAITKIDITMVVPRHMQDSLKKTLLFELDRVFPGVDTEFLLVEDSRHNARVYTLLVAHTSTDLRFGRDWLYDKKTRDKSFDEISVEIAKRVVGELDTEVKNGGFVDEHLQDQLIVFQALAEGETVIPGTLETATSDRKRVEKADEPFGDGSTHTKTARWVSSQLLPTTVWRDSGRLCKGAGWKAPAPLVESAIEALEPLHIT